MSMTIVLIISIFFTAMCAAAIFYWVREQLEEFETYTTERFVNIGMTLAELREQQDNLSVMIQEVSVVDEKTTEKIVERFEKNWESAVDKIMNYDPFRGDNE